jgi:hypothetical protein
VAPILPVGPWAPVGPVEPVPKPAGPVGPTGPVGPWAPVEPVPKPAGPVGPTGPVGPVDPFPLPPPIFVINVLMPDIKIETELLCTKSLNESCIILIYLISFNKMQISDILQKRPLDSRGNRMIDFSRCGNIRMNDLPRVEKVLEWQTGPQSDRIQQALNNLNEGEFIRLNAGTWQLNKPLRIVKRRTGIKGVSNTNTILRATWTGQDSVIQVNGGQWRLQEGSRIAITADVPVGTRSITVANASSFAVGDSVIIRRFTNWTYIDELKCREFGWTPSSFTMNMDRRIVGINGNQITLDDDIVVEISARYGGGQIFKYRDNRLTDIIVSSLRITSVFTSDIDEAHAKIGIQLISCAYCLVNRVSTEIVQTHTDVDASCRFIQVENGVYTNPKSQDLGQRRYAYNVDGANTLVLRCTADSARHSFVSGARAMGPNAFSYCTATNELNDTGPHQRHASGFLYNNVNANIRVQHRGPSGSGHGVAGVWHFIWNSGLANKIALQSFGSTAKNIGIGISNIDYSFMYPEGGEEFADVISRGAWVSPQSLL